VIVLCVRTWLVVSLVVVAACDSSSDPPPESVFPQENRFGRSIGGIVYSDSEPASFATVHIDKNANSGSDDDFNPGSDSMVYTTDDQGVYRFVTAPFRYDMTILHGSDVVVLRDFFGRYPWPQIGGTEPPKGFVVNVSPTLDPPLPSGMAASFFASGDDAATLSGDLASGLSLGIRHFATAAVGDGDSTAILYAVVYPEGGSIANATAYGRVPLFVQADRAAVVIVPVASVSDSANVAFEVSAPPGFLVEPIQISVDFGVRTISMPAATLAQDEQLHVALIPFARWIVQATATSAANAAVVTRSGLIAFDTSYPLTQITLPPPPVPISFANGVIEGDGIGVREHLLEPLDGQGQTLRILTLDRYSSLADPTLFQLPAPVGRYRWTMTNWPFVTQMEAMGGPDGRVNSPSATAASTEIVVAP